MQPLGGEGTPLADITTVRVHDEAIAESHVHFGMPRKKTFHFAKGAGQILFIAVEVGQQVAPGATISAVHRVIHAAIFFRPRADAWILWEPIQGAVVRAGVLNEVLQRNPLIRHGSDAQLEPARAAEAGRDDGKAWWRHLISGRFPARQHAIRRSPG